VPLDTTQAKPKKKKKEKKKKKKKKGKLCSRATSFPYVHIKREILLLVIRTWAIDLQSMHMGGTSAPCPHLWQVFLLGALPEVWLKEGALKQHVAMPGYASPACSLGELHLRQPVLHWLTTAPASQPSHLGYFACWPHRKTLSAKSCRTKSVGTTSGNVRL
jgi:hypothetical protein